MDKLDGSPPAKESLLFLCHRIPYPPDKGDKIRAFHLLRHLSRHFNVYLATFIDDPADWQHTSAVDQFCRASVFVEQNRFLAFLRSAMGFFSGEALSVPYYSSRKMTESVASMVLENKISRVIVYSSVMAQFTIDHIDSFERKIIDFVDVDSDKWRQYAEKKPWPVSWVYQRESTKLLDYDIRIARLFDVGLFVSSAEAQLFRQLSPDTSNKIGFYNNGVDTEYFSPSSLRTNPYPATSQPLVFTGAMDYWPNIDAVVWFAQNVMPELLRHNPALVFYVVGSNPAKAVLRLGSNPAIVVTGRVNDVRPYVQHASAVVAPMRIARGVQNKVLEGMSMGKPVLVSDKGLEGIEAIAGKHVLIANDVDDYLNSLDEVDRGVHTELGVRAREYVSRYFTWEKSLPEVSSFLAHTQNENGWTSVPRRSGNKLPSSSAALVSTHG